MYRKYFILLIIIMLSLSLCGCEWVSASAAPQPDTPSSRKDPVFIIETPELLDPDGPPVPELVPLESHLERGDDDRYVMTCGDLWPKKTPVPSAWHGPEYGRDATFASDIGCLAVAWGDNPVRVAVSTDFGGSWTNVSLPVTEINAHYKAIGMTSYTDGWLIVGSGSFQPENTEEMHTYLFYTTSDGGRSWTYSSSPVFAGDLTGGTFASKEIGWLCFEEEDSPEPLVYETKDGGLTWAESILDLLPGMTDGMIDSQTEVPMWTGQRWVLGINITRRDGFTPQSLYQFRPVEGGWAWVEPGWELPEHISPISLYDYVAWFVPYVGHDTALGIEAGSPQADGLLCDAYKYLMRTGTQIQSTGTKSAIVPAGAVQQAAYYKYGVQDFDTAMIPGFRTRLGGFLHSLDHAHNERSAKLGRPELRSTTPLPDGNIELVIDTYIANEAGKEELAASYWCRLQPHENGMFSLLRCEETEPPQAS